MIGRVRNDLSLGIDAGGKHPALIVETTGIKRPTRTPQANIQRAILTGGRRDGGVLHRQRQPSQGVGCGASVLPDGCDPQFKTQPRGIAAG